MTAPRVEVPAERSAAGLSREEWTRTRHAAAFDAALARGLSRELAWRVATALLGHWSIECGWGGAEWRFNLGNIKPGSSSAWGGPVQVLPDRLIYRAYGSLAEGVDDAVRLASGEGSNPAYAPAWRYLLETGDGVGWYDRLMRAGWHPWSAEALATYRATSARVAATVGTVSPPASVRWTPVVVTGAAIAAAFYALARSARRR